jgi:replicative DNA helicase
LRSPGYPTVLDTVVNRLITDWEIFKANQAKLHNIALETNPKALADLVKEAYIRRKQAYKELEHYKKTKKVLGEHPLFELLHLKDDISALDTPKLSKKVNALRANISRNKQKQNLELVTRDEELLRHAISVLEKR